MKREKQFIWLTKAWYGESTLRAWRGQDLVDEVLLLDNAGNGEFAVRWYWLGLSRRAAPRLEAFCDAWAFLADCPEVTKFLARHDSGGLSPAEFVRGLKDMGWVDATPTEPNH